MHIVYYPLLTVFSCIILNTRFIHKVYTGVSSLPECLYIIAALICHAHVYELCKELLVYDSLSIVASWKTPTTEALASVSNQHLKPNHHAAPHTLTFYHKLAGEAPYLHHWESVQTPSILLRDCMYWLHYNYAGVWVHHFTNYSFCTLTFYLLVHLVRSKWDWLLFAEDIKMFHPLYWKNWAQKMHHKDGGKVWNTKLTTHMHAFQSYSKSTISTSKYCKD